MGATNSNRERCTYLCDVLYRRLQLRLPTEQTYAAMVSVVSCVDQASGDKGTQAWSLHVLLQELKATWRSTCTRLKKWHKDPTTLLACLPDGFEDLPEEIQAAHGSTRPADPASRPIRADAVVAEASQVSMARNSHCRAYTTCNCFRTAFSFSRSILSSVCLSMCLRIMSWRV